MSLYGALYSGVSGLTAQSSAMGAISDNITNVSTIGFKNTNVNFQTLVTKQASSTFYSAGGVQSKPRQSVDVQGLLQASTSQTDIAISGGGFFVVNQASQPASSDPYFYSRAGSFKMDSNGYLSNSSGYYLQAWPTDASGEIITANTSLSQTNLNVISSDYLTTVNLARVAGSAAATTTMSIGANLPSDTDAGDSHKTDVPFFDSLGTARSISFNYTKVSDNVWDIGVSQPPKTAVVTSYDSAGAVYDSRGQLEFTGRPADGSTVIIDGITYEFDDDGFYGGAVAKTSTVQFGGTYEAGDTYRVTVNGVNFDQAVAAGPLPATLGATMDAIATAINAHATVGAAVSAVSDGVDTITITSLVPDTDFTYASSVPVDAGTVDITNTDTTTVAYVTPTTTQVDVSNSTTLAADVTAFIAAVKATDSNFADYSTTGDDITNNRISLNADYSYIVDFQDDGTGDISVNPSALLDSSGVAVTNQTATFTVQQPGSAYGSTTNLTFANLPVDNETITINGITYEFDSDASGVTTGDVAVTVSAVDNAANIATMLANLAAAIETNDPYYPSGTVMIRDVDNTGTNNTLALNANTGRSYTIDATGITNTPGSVTDAYGNTIDGTTTTVSQTAALNFSSGGQPSSINIASVEIIGFSNGASDMDGTTSDRISVDFGTIDASDGMTQYGSEFTPGDIQQNGSKFGTFAGVSISDDGLVTALFDNGDTRPVYQIPVATFTNPNGLESRSGNVWNASEASGDYTLRSAGNGAAGVITQASLEASTVDIGAEFTNMIVVQRAYSASTKIISTADQMLEELMRVKR